MARCSTRSSFAITSTLVRRCASLATAQWMALPRLQPTAPEAVPHRLRSRSPGQDRPAFFMTMRSALFLFATLAAAAAAQEPAPVSAVQADTLMQAGAAAEQHGDWKAAIEDFRKVIQLE